MIDRLQMPKNRCLQMNVLKPFANSSKLMFANAYKMPYTNAHKMLFPNAQKMGHESVCKCP